MQPHRWVVERCFAWLTRKRRRASDCERKVPAQRNADRGGGDPTAGGPAWEEEGRFCAPPPASRAQRWPAAIRQSLDRRSIPSASVNGTAASASFFQNWAWYSGLDVAMIMRSGAETSPR
jgi:hypothetical protein